MQILQYTQLSCDTYEGCFTLWSIDRGNDMDLCNKYGSKKQNFFSSFTVDLNPRLKLI